MSVFVLTFDQLERNFSEIRVSIGRFLGVPSLCSRALFRRS